MLVLKDTSYIFHLCWWDIICIIHFIFYLALSLLCLHYTETFVCQFCLQNVLHNIKKNVFFLNKSFNQLWADCPWKYLKRRISVKYISYTCIHSKQMSLLFHCIQTNLFYLVHAWTKWWRSWVLKAWVIG
jgi:hypothetical protein